MIPTSRVRWSATAALVTALVLSGCVASEDESTDAGSAATSSSPAPSASSTPPSDETDEEQDDDSSGGSTDNAQGGGSSNSGSNSGGSSTPAPPAPPAATPAPPAPPSGPTAAVTNQRCSGGKLIVTLTANADGSYRKGITAVTLERQNEYNAWLDSPATWLGPETGQGNQWTGDLPGNQQNIGKTLKVTVAGTTGSTTVTVPVSAPC